MKKTILTVYTAAEHKRLPGEGIALLFVIQHLKETSLAFPFNEDWERACHTGTQRRKAEWISDCSFNSKDGQILMQYLSLRGRGSNQYCFPLCAIFLITYRTNPGFQTHEAWIISALHTRPALGPTCSSCPALKVQTPALIPLHRSHFHPTDISYP